MVKFNKHHVTDGTTKARVFYSLDNRTDGRKCVTLYHRDYTDALFAVLGSTLGENYRDDTDFQTDYFEKGRAVIFEAHPLYVAARTRAEELKSARVAQ